MTEVYYWPQRWFDAAVKAGFAQEINGVQVFNGMRDQLEIFVDAMDVSGEAEAGKRPRSAGRQCLWFGEIRGFESVERKVFDGQDE